MQKATVALLLVFVWLIAGTANVALADNHTENVISDNKPQFYPIVPIPNVTDVENVSFPQYINQLFQIAVSVSAMLAVVMLMFGGFEYMTSEATGGKKNGLDRIRGAVIGLLLLLGAYVILYVINPCILEITAFSNDASDCSPQIERWVAPTEERITGQVNATTGTISLSNGTCFNANASAIRCSGGDSVLIVCYLADGSWAPATGGTCPSGATTFGACEDGDCVAVAPGEITTRPVPTGACLRDATYTCGGQVEAAEVCVVEENGQRRYFDKPDSRSCITGTGQFMCAAGCPNN